MAMRRRGELWMLGVLCSSYWLIYAVDAPDLYRFMNVTGPVALTAILGWSCYGIARQSSIAIWAPLFWFRLACAAYYGFGALVPHIVNFETREYIFSLYFFDDALNFKINLIYCSGIFGTLVFARLILRPGVNRLPAATAGNGPDLKSRMFLFALGFLLVGAVLRYAVVLPYALGLMRTTLPGMFMTLAKTFYVGVFLMIVYAMRYDRKILTVMAPLILFEIAVSVATFAKMELLLILVFSFLGFISHRATRTRMVTGALCVLGAYFLFQPLVGYGRIEVIARYGGEAAGIEERWKIVQDYLDGGRDTAKSHHQGGLSRLSYVNVGAFVVDQYDAGRPGDTFRDAFAVFIPRVLWPDKPIITQLGQDLNFMVFGRYGSALGVGHFAEAYWNFGWVGFVPFMAALALILSVFTRVSMAIMARQDWLFLPVVFIGVNMGLRVDGHFVPDILGPAWIAICLGLALRMAQPILMASAMRKTTPPSRTARVWGA